ncbi:hypothetical protein NQ193_14425 [Clostridium perfringens]|uniref:hypothetical protein n=1 Tax=Clostridium perfringens TaxID=1502 RepID=UPI002148C637|nr:hypothetical protein [Clostridium perfringens]UUR83920.1 hypothetical protein NQ193_14425 [Clostridium perfringens]
METKLKPYEREYLKIIKQINTINEELVSLLNKIEKEFLYNPFESNSNNKIKELWEKVSKARNYNIY